MGRKTTLTNLTVVAITLGFATAEISGAVAQGDDALPVEPEALTDEVVPVFVSEEVVQPVPAATEGDETSPEAQVDAQPAAVTVPEAGSLRQLVRSLDAPTDLDRQMECLAGTVYFEARGEPIAGQLAVAKVVMNRAESDVFPSTYCDVVYQRSQFSFVRGGKMPRIKRASSAWQRAKKIARIAHDDLWDSEAKDSLYFHARYVSPRWSRTKSRRAAIKTHIFYR